MEKRGVVLVGVAGRRWGRPVWGRTGCGLRAEAAVVGCRGFRGGAGRGFSAASSVKPEMGGRFSSFSDLAQCVCFPIWPMPASREIFLYFAVPAFGMGSMVNEF